MEQFNVVVKSIETNEVLDTANEKPMTERMAEKFERGFNINLNHSEYYTEIVPSN